MERCRGNLRNPQRKPTAETKSGSAFGGAGRGATRIPHACACGFLTGGKGVGERSRSLGRILAPETRLLPPPSRYSTSVKCDLAWLWHPMADIRSPFPATMPTSVLNPLRSPFTMHPAALPPATLAKQCDEVRTRRSGPGGQHRNKVETAVVLVHRPTGIAAEASERRSQSENRRMALRRLRLRLATEHRTPAGPQPSECWRSRTRGRQLLISVGHDDYPALLAEAFDQLQAVGWQMAPAAQVLGINTSQLIGLLRKAPAAWAKIHTLRATTGLAPLK